MLDRDQFFESDGLCLGRGDDNCYLVRFHAIKKNNCLRTRIQKVLYFNRAILR